MTKREADLSKTTDEHLTKLARITHRDIASKKRFPFSKDATHRQPVIFNAETRTMIAKVVSDIAKELLEIP